MVKEFNTYEQLEEIVKLAAQPLPERPDGIVTVAKFTSATRDDCRTTEAEYERLVSGSVDSTWKDYGLTLLAGSKEPGNTLFTML
jgi:hypothetical protein